MILTGNQIKWAKEQGYLDISDWDESRLNPNSYNLRLADEIGTYIEPIPLDEATGWAKRYEEDPDFANVVNNLYYQGHSIKDLYPLDMKQEMKLHIQKIPEEGYVLQPGVLYLARTMEYTETNKFVPMLEGRSSVGRLGISIHSTAGFGDIGFCGYWTLEISCVQPVRIYAGVEICQIYYHTISPDIWIPNDNIVSCETCRHWPPENKWPCEDCLMQNGHDRWESSIIKYGDSGKYQKNTGIQPSMMWKEFQDELYYQ